MPFPLAVDVSLVIMNKSFSLASIGCMVLVTFVLLFGQDDGQELLQACISEQWDVAKALVNSGSTLEAQDKVVFYLLVFNLCTNWT